MKARLVLITVILSTCSFLLVLFVYLVKPFGGEEFDIFQTEILDNLKSIKAYEMKISYTERARPGSLFGKNIKLDSLTNIKYKSPNLLCINVNSTFTCSSGNKKSGKKVTIYTTFDGKHQKCRSTMVTNGKSTTKSIVMDQSVNSQMKDFNGRNIKGFGLFEGKDYIGTVKDLISCYDMYFIFRLQRKAKSIEKYMIDESYT